MDGSRQTLSLNRIDSAKVSLDRVFPGIVALFQALYPIVLPHRGLIVLNWLLPLVRSAVSAAPILLAKSIVENFRDGSAAFLSSLGLLAVIIVLRSALELISGLSVGVLNYRIRRDLEVEFIRRVTHQPLSYYDGRSSGEILIAPFTQIPFLMRATPLFFRSFLQAAGTCVFALVVLLFLDIRIGVLSLCILPFFFLGSSHFGRRLERNMSRVLREFAKLHSTILESLLAVRTVRTMGIAEEQVRIATSITERALGTELRTVLLAGAQRLSVQIVFAVGMVLLLVTLRSQFISGAIDLATCTAALAAFVLFVHEAQKFVTGVIEVRTVLGATAPILEFLQDTAAETAEPDVVPSAEVKSLRVEGLAFAYPRAVPVLCGIDAVFSRGSLTAVTGESGVGKSTLADLLLRLRTPAGGRILLDGLDLSRIRENWLRGAFALVDQTPYLFNTTIRGNFMLPCPDISEDEIRAQLQAARALDFVDRLPLGMDTVVGEGGDLLSVGEKQRLVLARALAQRPQVLVMDEVTAALDQENEAIILDSLGELASEMIVILITHKESVVARCDKVYVLQRNGTCSAATAAL